MNLPPTSPADGGKGTEGMPGDRAAWVYAVARRIDESWLAGVAGVAGGPLRAVTAAGLAAAVTGVSLDDFGEEPLRRHLEDLSWLDATARRHHQVIEIIARHEPVIPMRLATVFDDDRGVAGLLTQRRDEFAAALGQIDGRTEWGIKIYAGSASDDQVSPGEDGADARETAASPGAAYLRRRKRAISADSDARLAASASADAIHAALARLAAAAQLRPPQAPQLSGQQERMVLNAAYLVDDARSEEFAAAADSLAGSHPAVRVTLTGPWPPYSFASADVPGSPPEGTRA
jgi:hypothetical protein